MDEKEIKEIKEQMIFDLKKSIEDSSSEEFVENYETWQKKMKYINIMISNVDSTIPQYEYNEFCKKIIDFTNDCLNNIIDYNKLFLTKNEYLKIIKENYNNREKAEQAILEEINKKYMNNCMLIINSYQMKEAVRYKLKDKFTFVEADFEKATEIAKSKIDNFENKNNFNK
jgi:hypothetical protein